MVHAYDKGMLDGIHRLDTIIRQVFSEKHVENGTDQAQKEYLYLMMLVMKNELRNTDNTAIERIRTLCAENNTPEMIRRGPKELSDTANRLIAFVMKRPTKMRIRIIRRIFILKNRK